eukprot:scpid13762/ scgid19767/ 
MAAAAEQQFAAKDPLHTAPSGTALPSNCVMPYTCISELTANDNNYVKVQHTSLPFNVALLSTLVPKQKKGDHSHSAAFQLALCWLTVTPNILSKCIYSS